MRGFVAVARREMGQRRLAWYAALLTAVLPFAVPVARGLSGQPAREAREMLAAILATGFAAAFAAVLGWSSVSRDLADGRIAFDFARPLSGGAIWAGRLGAAFVLAVGGGAVIWIPTLAASQGITLPTALPWWTPFAVVGAAAFLTIGAHAAGIALRSRSALLAIDAGCLLAAAVAVPWIVGSLLRRRATSAILVGSIGAGLVLVVGLVIGGIAAVVAGRLDPRRAHRALSVWLWAGLAAAVAGFGGYAGWVLSAGPRDLVLAEAVPAPRGSWVAIDGGARGAWAGFLLDTATGRFLPAGAPWSRGWFLPTFSADGRTAVWLEPAGDSGPFGLVSLRLDLPGARPVRAPAAVASMPFELVVSQDGTRFAALSGDDALVGDVRTGRTLASARIGEAPGYSVAAFLRPDLLRLYRRSDRRLEIFDLDVNARRVTRTGTVDDLKGWFWFCADAANERLLVRDDGGSDGGTRLRLFDARTGEAKATLLDEPKRRGRWMDFLSDGRVVFATAGDDGSRLRVFSRDGTPLRTIDLPAASGLQLGGEPAPGKILVAAGSPNASSWDGGSLLLVDADAGTSRRVADDLTLAAWLPQPAFPRLAGSEASKLFYGPGRSLVRFDPTTGERRTLVAGRKPPPPLRAAR